MEGIKNFYSLWEMKRDMESWEKKRRARVLFFVLWDDAPRSGFFLNKSLLSFKKRMWDNDSGSCALFRCMKCILYDNKFELK